MPQPHLPLFPADVTEAEGRKPCTRFHYVSDDPGKTYIRCERSDCGWRAEVIKPHYLTISSPARKLVGQRGTVLVDASRVKECSSASHVPQPRWDGPQEHPRASSKSPALPYGRATEQIRGSSQ